jgi:multiple sugar transport system substrate-binding protein
MDPKSALAGLCTALAVHVLIGGGAISPASAETKELTIGYMKHPIQDASIDIMERHAKEQGIAINRVPLSYTVYLERVTTSLTSGSSQYDIIWHNDDWGPIWARWLEPTNDIPGMAVVDKSRVDIAFLDAERQPTVVPMVHTIGVFYYRKDLVTDADVPKTWDDMVRVGQKLQKESRIKWGFVGGMVMNYTWPTWLWSLWSNNCDMFAPVYGRTKSELETTGFKPLLGEPCARETVEFWWDNINKSKISPAAMPSYKVDDANAIFMAGDAAFTVADSTFYGQYNDPAKSKVAGKVGIANFPIGPRRSTPIAWNSIWGWAIPKGVPEERKTLARAVLNAMLLDEDGNVALFERTGGPPPNTKVWDRLAARNDVFRMIKRSVFDLPPENIVHGTWYYEQWPAVHKAFAETLIKAVIGSREDIGRVLAEGGELLHRTAVSK